MHCTRTTTNVVAEQHADSGLSSTDRRDSEISEQKWLMDGVKVTKPQTQNKF